MAVDLPSLVQGDQRRPLVSREWKLRRLSKNTHLSRWHRDYPHPSSLRSTRKARGTRSEARGKTKLSYFLALSLKPQASRPKNSCASLRGISSRWGQRDGRFSSASQKLVFRQSREGIIAKEESKCNSEHGSTGSREGCRKEGCCAQRPARSPAANRPPSFLMNRKRVTSGL